MVISIYVYRFVEKLYDKNVGSVIETSLNAIPQQEINIDRKKLNKNTEHKADDMVLT